MTSRSRIVLFLSGALAAGCVVLLGQAPKKSPIPYPTGYRQWMHVKSMVIWGNQHPLFDRFGGLHNVYVNATGWPSFQQGRTFPDGTVFVFDLYDIRTSPGAMEAKGRKFVAVMRKNAKLHSGTGGWGWEVFKGYQQTGSLQDAKGCFDCHASQKSKDFVFSDYME